MGSGWFDCKGSWILDSKRTCSNVLSIERKGYELNSLCFKKH